jgi:hypothetical protein
VQRTKFATLPHSIDVTVDPENNFIDVDIQMVAQVLLPFGFWEENPMKIHARALAYGHGRLCILGLDPSKSDTIKATANAVITAPDCAVQSNSKNASGLKVDNGGSLVSSLICSSGGYSGDGSFEPTPQVDCPLLEDPLSEREPPGVGGCDDLDREIKGETLSISPGVYCGGLKISGEAEVTAEPGNYVFTGGKLEVKDKSTFQGENVSLYFADDDSVFTFDKDTTIDLTAPKDGLMAGILVYESQSVAKGHNYTIKSENAKRLLGTIYLPNGKLVVDSKSDVAAESAYTVIVAKQIEIKGANLVVNADYGGSDVPVPEGVGPNSSMVRLTR